MLDRGVVEEIRRLLRAGDLSQREIAKKVGVSRGTVLAIAKGRRGDRIRRAKREDDAALLDKGPLRRCPQCGALVYMPCRACQARKIKEASKWPPSKPNQRLRRDP